MTGNSKAKMNPLKGQHHPQAPGALQLSCLKHREMEAGPRTQGQSETRVSDDPPTLSCTHSSTHPPYHLSAHLYPFIHPSTQPYGSTHTSVSHPFPYLFIYSPTNPPTTYPFTHPFTDIQFKNSFTIHSSPIHSPIHQANFYLLSINYEPSPISNNTYPPYSH